MDFKGRKLKGRGNITVEKEDPWSCGMYNSKKWYYVGLTVLYIMIIVCLIGVFTSGGCVVAPDQQPAQSLADTLDDVRTCVVHVRGPEGGQGSGAVISPIGTIITARHVTDGSRGPFEITFDNGEVMETSLVWEDPNRDVAYLQLPLRPGQLIEQSGWLAECSPRVGERVVIFGSPLGFDFFNTASPGHVTAKGRNLHDVLNEYDDERRFLWINMLQTNAPSYPGNSGGPVFNEEGGIVGILVAGYDPTLNFAVCVEDIRLTVMEASIDLFNGRTQIVDKPAPEYEEYPYWYDPGYVGVM